jgi:hypothetical protein
VSPVLAQLSSALLSSERRPLLASFWPRRPWPLLPVVAFSFQLQVSNLRDLLLPASFCLRSPFISLILALSVALLPIMPFTLPNFHRLPLLLLLSDFFVFSGDLRLCVRLFSI